MSDEKPKRKFAVGLSFPGEVRDFARELYRKLSRKFGSDRVFLDEKFTPQLLGVDLDNKLREIYRDECFLLVPIFCCHYEKKWCRIEWRTIRSVILESKNEDRVIPVALDDTRIDGWEPTDYSIRGNQYSVSEIARLIHKVFIDRSGEASTVPRSTPPKGRNSLRAGRGASQSADRPSPTTNTAIPQHERCLLRVFVNNRLRGSGVLIAGRLIVTSGSVVQCQNEPVKVQFYSHGGGPPSKQGKSTGSVKGLHDVAVVAEVWQAGEPHQVVILRLADDVPQGATPASLCEVSSMQMRVECRGVSAEMTASGQGTPPLVTGLVTTSGTLQLELENNAHRERLAGGPVFCARTKQIVGLVGGMAETVTTPASVFSVLRSSATLWAEFLRSETQHVHSQAEQRLNERIREALRGKSSLLRSILSEFRIVERPDPPVESVIGCLKKMPITKLAN
ncbi:MAG: TIR domain-containing protein, partial [Planctomycetaceae bacterium]